MKLSEVVDKVQALANEAGDIAAVLSRQCLVDPTRQGTVKRLEAVLLDFALAIRLAGEALSAEPRAIIASR